MLDILYITVYYMFQNNNDSHIRPMEICIKLYNKLHQSVTGGLMWCTRKKVLEMRGGS